jgi:uncharacterized protein (DUF433 family)
MKSVRCLDEGFYGDIFKLKGADLVQDEARHSRHGRFWTYRRRNHPTTKDFSISLREAFSVAQQQVPSVVVKPGLVGGNPCIVGTRIPVYMILDAIEYHGSVKAVLKSYPQLSAEQIKDAVRFSKIALECCVEH